MGTLDKSTSMSLLERVRSKDEEAWRRLLHLYTPLVANWCGRRGVLGQDADDVTQEVFLAVSGGLADFQRDRPGDTFRGWLRGICRYKILDYYRQRGTGVAAQGGTVFLEQLLQVAEQELPEDTEEDLSGLYHRALELVRSEFEARTWDAFWRVTIDGQTPADIAAELGVTPAAVRKAKSRVLFRLRQEVGDLTV
jgi:RNA polymerase sigma-70 factor, ECF subfamily